VSAKAPWFTVGMSNLGQYQERMKRVTPFMFLVLVCLLAPVLEAQSTNPPPPPQKANATQTHWLTISSGIRHNSTCRHFKNSKGRMCTKDEGRACKICGG